MPVGVYNHYKIKGRHTKGEFEKGRIPWNKGRNMSDYPQMGFQKEHKDFTSKEERIKTGKKMRGESHPFFGKKIYSWMGFQKGHKGFVSEEGYRKVSEKMMGENNPRWKGGISSESDKARHNFEMGLWRRAVLERDNFTCQKYGTKGGKLNVHHINNFSEFIELRTSIENGITLSEKAHKEFHKIYGKQNNTREQLN